ncbi:DNA-binding response regulator [Leptolyngbyaceae cyanobacterium CCMR0082]|uniref:DNA-binding response regulator n=1 Tax=Adonisia turfae CCMR0082 TaxID=2304604 RepID=A0A6M0S0J0_9CYAN|nr:DNA-binding response regulator [Adonisia turfae CCMR0082]
MATILIVEDEPQITAFLTKGFRRAGYEIYTAQSGVQALSLATSNNFDLILLDLGLPDLDGLSVLSATRSQGVQTPIIVITARDSDNDRQQSLSLGASDYITKPFRFSELLRYVRAHL